MTPEGPRYRCGHHRNPAGMWGKPALRTLARPYDGLALLAGGTAIVAVAALVWHAVTGQFIDVNGHCGWDGFWYCRMARGAIAQAPFNRRVLAPFIVRLMHFGSIDTRFLLLDFVSTVFAAIVTGVIVARIADRHRPAVVMITASIVLLFPFLWQVSVLYPASTEPLSAAVGFAWVASMIRDRPGWVVPPILAGAAVLTREDWVLPIVLSCGVLAWSRREIRWRVLPSVSTAIIAAIFALSQPTLPSGYSTSVFGTFHIMAHWIKHDVGSLSDIRLFAVYVVKGLGLVWLVLLPRWRWVLSDWRRRTLIAVALGHGVLAVTGGGDTDRLLLEAGIAMVAIVGAAVADGQVPLVPFTALLTGTVLLWSPWHVTSPANLSAYFDYWGPRYAPLTAQARVALEDFTIAGLTVLTAILAMRPWRPRAAQ